MVITREKKSGKIASKPNIEKMCIYTLNYRHN